MSTPPPPKGWTQEEIDKQLQDLDQEAEQQKQAYMRSHVPPELQSHLQYYLANPPPPELESNEVVVRHGDQVRVQDSFALDLPGSPGTASVMNSHLDFVVLDLGR